MLGEAARTLGQRLFGGTCFLCRGASGRALLCVECNADLPRLGVGLCPRCAAGSPAGAVCGRCLAKPPRYDVTVAALEYRFPADVLVQSLKFRGELALAPLLGELLLKRIPEDESADFVVPVPLSKERLRERGFNQALEIARPIARSKRARLAPGLCERVRDTRAQADLAWTERDRNVRGAFACAGFAAGATVAVVDDVMTTGATLDALAAALKDAGAARVVNWVVARTPAPGGG